MAPDGPSRFKSRFSILSLLPARHPPIIISQPLPPMPFQTQHLAPPRKPKAEIVSPIESYHASPSTPISPITALGPEVQVGDGRAFLQVDPYGRQGLQNSPDSRYTHTTTTPPPMPPPSRHRRPSSPLDLPPRLVSPNASSHGRNDSGGSSSSTGSRSGGRRDSPARPRPAPLDMDKVHRAYPPKADVIADSNPTPAPMPPAPLRAVKPRKESKTAAAPLPPPLPVSLRADDPFEVVEIEPGHRYPSWQRGKVDIKPGQVIPRDLPLGLMPPPLLNPARRDSAAPEEETYDSVLADVLLTPTYLRPSPSDAGPSQAWSPTASSPSARAARSKRKTLLGKVGEVVSTAARKSVQMPRGILRNARGDNEAERSLRAMREREAREMDRFRLAQHKAGVDVGRSYTTSLSPVMDLRQDVHRRSPGWVGAREYQIGVADTVYADEGKRSKSRAGGREDWARRQEAERLKRRQKIWRYGIIVAILLLVALVVGLCTTLLTRSSSSSSSGTSDADSSSVSSAGSTAPSATSSASSSTATPASLASCLQQFSSSAPSSPSSYPCADCYPLLASTTNDFTTPLVDGNSTNVGAAMQFCALMDVLKDVPDSSTLKSGGWAGNASPCSGWSGVSCDSRGRVTQLTLKYPNVPSTFESTISGLVSLQKFQMMGNSSVPSGAFPSSLLSLSNLTSLDIEYTALTGPLQQDWFDSAPQLQALYLVNNAQLGSTLPSLGNTKLTTLAVNNQKLTQANTDSLPSSLTYLDLSYNSLGGQVPSFSQLTSLQTLLLEDNVYTSAPSSLPASLSTLSLTSNTGLTGDMPAAVCSSSTLTDCDLRSTSLTASTSTDTTASSTATSSASANSGTTTSASASASSAAVSGASTCGVCKF